MALASFYVSDLLDQQNDVVLGDDEAKHALRVRRLEHGTRVRLFDGHGAVATGILAVMSKARACVEIDFLETLDRPAAKLSVACALPKGDRQRTLIEGLTQLGVAQFIPLVCARSISKYQAKTWAKWHRYSIEACKQSQNPFLLKVNEPQSLEQVLASQTQCYYLDQSGQKTIPNRDSCTLIIGPEGGFSDHEMKLLQGSATGNLCLSPHILRTETAAIVGAAMFQASLVA